MLFSSPSGLWTLYGNSLQVPSPQFKEFESTYQCHREAESSGDLPGLWKLAVSWGPQIYRVSGRPRGGHRIRSKNSSMFLFSRVGCAHSQLERCAYICVSTCVLISSSSLCFSQKENDNFNISEKDIEITLFHGENKQLNCSFENITRNQDLTTILCKIKGIRTANRIASSSKKVRVSPLTVLSVSFTLFGGNSLAKPEVGM